MKTAIGTGFFLLLGMLLSAPAVARAQAPARSPVLTTAHFAFFSDFDTNLNDALIAAGLARKRAKPELFRSGPEVPCFGKLPRSVRAAWDGAVNYYAEIISPGGWTTREQYLIRVRLAGFDEELKDEDGEFVELARNFMAAATPAYRACRWTDQDGRNHRWIEDLEPRLSADERRIALRLQELYQKQWNGLPIPVDIVETVDWSGANTILRNPTGGHLLISNATQGPAALEVVFHEASHLLMGVDSPVRLALDAAAAADDWKMPGDLWHVVLFYTTGEAVRRILEDGGNPGYRPMLDEIFDRGTWVGYRQALESDWRPYLDGDRTLPEAAAGLVGALRKPVVPQTGESRPNRSGR